MTVSRPAMMVAILAGGEGRRIGGGKPGLMLGGETLLERALAIGRCWSEDVRLVLRAPTQCPDAPVPIIVDDPAIEGPLGGLSAALRVAREQGVDRVTTLPCDMPFLPATLGASLSDAITDHGAAVARSDGRLHPVVGLWRASALDALPSYLASGRRSLAGFAQAVGYVALDCLAEAMININDAADLAEAERRLRR